MTSMSDYKRIAVTVAYDGKDFQGWQVQPEARTVQGEIEKAFAMICNADAPRIHGSGRTDTGVHARGQVFHVNPCRVLETQKWLKALNGVLPEDVRVMAVREVDDQFHARFDAIKKQYRYFVYADEVMPPELRFTRLHERRKLDLASMQQAAALLQGEHDFLSFSANRGKPEESTVRHLYQLALELNGPEICVIAEANGFMYKMVRQLVGALLRVGLGEMRSDDIQHLLDSPERSHLAPTAAAQGLFLWQVFYPE